MSLVIDASVVVAALAGSGSEATWAEQQLGSGALHAPHLLPVEVSSALRRAVMTRGLSSQVASLAHEDLRGLPLTLVPYDVVAARVWELRNSVTAYDACYVALAELLAAPLATLDLRLTRAPGPTCAFLTP